MDPTTTVDPDDVQTGELVIVRDRETLTADGEFLVFEMRHPDDPEWGLADGAFVLAHTDDVSISQYVNGEGFVGQEPARLVGTGDATFALVGVVSNERLGTPLTREEIRDGYGEQFHPLVLLGGTIADRDWYDID